jgi:dipeptidyl aminopeptidase/acylaminoacyl peptidase
MYQWIALLLLIFPGFLKVNAQTGLTADDISKIQSIGSGIISADAKWVAFTKVIPADPYKENKPARQELHVYDMTTGTSTPYFTRASVGLVAFRPMHQTITFLARAEGDAQRSLYEVPLSGGEARKIYSFETGIAFYDWSSDGRNLVFAASEIKGKTEEKPALPYNPVVYEDNTPLTRAYIVSLDNKLAREISVPGNFSFLKWSPDGSRILAAVAPTALVDDSYMKVRWQVIDAGTGESVGVIDHRGKPGTAAWSKDSKQIALIAGADQHDPTAGRLFVVSAQGGKPTWLHQQFPGKFEDLSWTDTGNLLVLTSEGTDAWLNNVKADGSMIQRMKNVSGLDISTFSMADNGILLLLASTPTHPNELFTVGQTTRVPNRITNSNPWLADRKFGRQEVVTYKAKDGLELQGMLIYPVKESPEKKYPLITVVHGGPEAHFRNGWLSTYSNLGQMAAAEGYLLFFPNYRGSTGRGLAFAMSSQADPAGKEFDDIVDGIDYLIKEGLADKAKIGVTGGSYGGYATGWMATRYSDRFAAGVMFVGISNNISKWGTTDIPEEEFLVHARKRIWEDYDFMLKRSPIYYADQCKTPLLIMHGADDPRVHPSQSMELYRHIKVRTNTPVSLVFYPGEGHGNRNATARLDFSLRTMRWFNQYLK